MPIQVMKGQWIPASPSSSEGEADPWLIETEPGGYAAPWTPASRGTRSRETVCRILRAIRANEHPGPVGAGVQVRRPSRYWTDG